MAQKEWNVQSFRKMWMIVNVILLISLLVLALYMFRYNEFISSLAFVCMAFACVLRLFYHRKKYKAYN